LSAIDLLAWAEVVLLPNARGVGRLSELAHTLDRTVVQHDNLGGLDFYYYDADFAAIKGDYFRELIDRADEVPTGEYDEVPLFLRQSLRGLQGLPRSRVEITGCVQFDEGLQNGTSITRNEFCQEYDLDPGKRIAVWLPDGAQNQDAWSQRKYVEICDAIEYSQNHNLIIKMHPNDYLRWKSHVHLAGKQSAEFLYPGGKVCRPEHKYNCFTHCDVGVTILSTVALEFPLFRKPMLFVDSQDSPIVQKYSHFRKSGIPVPGSVGSYCTAESLRSTLEGNTYDVAGDRLYDEQIRKFSCSADGRAHERVASLIERAAREMPAPSMGLRNLLKGGAGIGAVLVGKAHMRLKARAARARRE